MKLNIKLGEKGGPELPSTSETYYPSLHINGKKELDIPKEGLMTVRYKKVSSSESENEKSGPRYSCTIEVHEIVSAESDEVESPTKRNRESEDALDALVEEKHKEMMAKMGNTHKSKKEY